MADTLALHYKPSPFTPEPFLLISPRCYAYKPFSQTQEVDQFIEFRGAEKMRMVIFLDYLVLPSAV